MRKRWGCSLWCPTQKHWPVQWDLLFKWSIRITCENLTIQQCFTPSRPSIQLGVRPNDEVPSLFRSKWIAIWRYSCFPFRKRGAPKIHQSCSFFQKTVFLFGNVICGPGNRSVQSSGHCTNVVRQIMKHNGMMSHILTLGFEVCLTKNGDQWRTRTHPDPPHEATTPKHEFAMNELTMGSQDDSCHVFPQHLRNPRVSEQFVFSPLDIYVKEVHEINTWQMLGFQDCWNIGKQSLDTYGTPMGTEVGTRVPWGPKRVGGSVWGMFLPVNNSLGARGAPLQQNSTAK